MPDATARLTVADAVGRRLGQLGVDTVFGLVGSGNLVVTNALRDAGARFIATRTSNFRIDQHDLVASVGAIAERVHAPATAQADAARALRRAAIERRPVVLNMPIDGQAQPAVPALEIPAPALPRIPAPHSADIAAVIEVLAGARRPLIIAGRGAVVAGAGPTLRALGERCGALLANSAPAHGIFHGDRFALGICGGFSSPLAAELLPQADVVLTFGAGLNHWTTRHGALLDPAATVVQVDADPQAIGANLPVDLAVVGDAAAAAQALADEVGPSAGWRSEALAGRIATRRWRDEPYTPSGTAGVIDPRALSIALADLLPADKTVAIDSGHFTGWPAMFLDVRDPRHWLFVNGFQAVGLALGCAIGAAVAAPERLTVAALGDGGLFLSLAELETAARVGARLLVVVYDDAAYGAEVHHFGPQDRDLETVRFPARDLAAIARACGVPALEARSVAELEPVATWLQDGDGPLLVDAKVDPSIVADWLPDAFRGG